MCKTKRANKVVSRKSHSATRHLLAQYEWQEVELEAYVDRAGWTKISFARSSTTCQPTLLLKNIAIAGRIVADHLWIKQSVIASIHEYAAKLVSGAKIRIRATVYPYFPDGSCFKHIHNVNYSLKDVFVEAIA